MSGSNDPHREDNKQTRDRPEGGQPPGGQPQGGQPQGGQPPGGQPQGGQPQQGAGQPSAPQGGYRRGQYGGGGGGVLDQLQQPEPSSYIKGIVVAMVAAGLFLGVMVFLVGSIGGFPVLPEAVEQTQADAPDAAQGQIDDALSSSHQLLIGYLAAELAPFLAFLMAPIFGMLSALRMSVTPRTKQLTAGVGTFVGSVAFVVILTLLASIVIPETTDFGAAASLAGGVPSGSDQPTGLGSIQFGNTIINGVLVGLLAGATAFTTAYSVDNFLRT